MWIDGDEFSVRKNGVPFAGQPAAPTARHAPQQPPLPAPFAAAKPPTTNSGPSPHKPGLRAAPRRARSPPALHPTIPARNTRRPLHPLADVIAARGHREASASPHTLSHRASPFRSLRRHERMRPCPSVAAARAPRRTPHSRHPCARSLPSPAAPLPKPLCPNSPRFRGSVPTQSTRASAPFPPAPFISVDSGSRGSHPRTPYDEPSPSAPSPRSAPPSPHHRPSPHTPLTCSLLCSPGPCAVVI
ncbi:hypothetical protein PHLGIDRAFT_127878 [Phlebiopsis gigantea 11061_1 CR5-6]|uniref:Uncharacterized protein n=1 Tax=Phlebiopsis gigantea (strain 11061_1 CR5-6) TaxID=745531 RepID=A0A0C3SAF8_PHLG1|nr:hypothetical protein PHLGIDRAFT_127878 [Phlebiopsis gigantea 11061_1 CR5-6]